MNTRVWFGLKKQPVGAGCKESKKLYPCFCLNPHFSYSPLPLPFSLSLDGQVKVSFPSSFSLNSNKMVNSCRNKGGKWRKHTTFIQKMYSPLKMQNSQWSWLSTSHFISVNLSLCFLCVFTIPFPSCGKRPPNLYLNPYCKKQFTPQDGFTMDLLWTWHTAESLHLTLSVLCMNYRHNWKWTTYSSRDYSPADLCYVLRLRPKDWFWINYIICVKRQLISHSNKPEKKQNYFSVYTKCSYTHLCNTRPKSCPYKGSKSGTLIRIR